MFVLHELEVEVVFNQFQEHKEAIPKHSSDLRSLNHELFDGRKKTIHTFLTGYHSQLRLKAFSLIIDVI